MKEGKKYKVSDPGATSGRHREEIMDAMSRVLDSGRYIGGEENASFERELREYTGAGEAVGCASGLDALRLIFEALKISGKLKAGDKVMVAANTYIASALAITASGLEPVLVDADPLTLNMDTSLLEESMESGVKAIMPVHLYGRTCWDERIADFVSRHGLTVVEDLAQGIGCAYRKIKGGNIGDAAGLSFYPTKNLGALGDGGAILTRDKNLAQIARSFANYGSDRRYHNVYQGLNSRLDPLQAAILGVKIKHLDEENLRRKQIAEIYYRGIDNPIVTLPAKARTEEHVYHQFVVRVEAQFRDKFRKELYNKGVETDVHYPVPLHRQPCYSDLRWAQVETPVTDMLAKEVVSLPICPTLEDEDIWKISEIINNIKFI